MTIKSSFFRLHPLLSGPVHQKIIPFLGWEENPLELHSNCSWNESVHHQNVSCSRLQATFFGSALLIRFYLPPRSLHHNSYSALQPVCVSCSYADLDIVLSFDENFRIRIQSAQVMLEVLHSISELHTMDPLSRWDTFLILISIICSSNTFCQHFACSFFSVHSKQRSVFAIGMLCDWCCSNRIHLPNQSDFSESPRINTSQWAN